MTTQEGRLGAQCRPQPMLAATISRLLHSMAFYTNAGGSRQVTSVAPTSWDGSCRHAKATQRKGDPETISQLCCSIRAAATQEGARGSQASGSPARMGKSLPPPPPVGPRLQQKQALRKSHQDGEKKAPGKSDSLEGELKT